MGRPRPWIPRVPSSRHAHLSSSLAVDHLREGAMIGHGWSSSSDVLLAVDGMWMSVASVPFMLSCLLPMGVVGALHSHVPEVETLPAMRCPVAGVSEVVWGKAVKAPSLHAALEEGRTQCLVPGTAWALNELLLGSLFLPLMRLSWLPILPILLSGGKIMAMEARAPSHRATRRSPDRRLWRLRVDSCWEAIKVALFTKGCFPLLARRNTGAEKVALKFRIILGLPIPNL